MATGGGPTREQGPCSLCLEPYAKQRPPKILPCFHTFCLDCLTALADSREPDRRPDGSQQTGGGQAGQRADDAKDDGKDEKDTAAAKPGGDSESGDVTNTAGDVTNTAGGDVTNTAGDVTNTASDVTNTSTTDDVTGVGADAERAASFLCPACRAPVPIPEGGVAALQTNFYLSCEDTADEDASSRRSGKRECCPVHQEQEFCFYCQPCDVVICMYCKITAHEGHATADIASAVFRAKSDLGSMRAVAQQQLDVLEASVRRVERDDRDLSHYSQTVKREINATYDATIAGVTQSRDQLIGDVSEKEERARRLLSAEKSSAAFAAGALSGLIARAARAGGFEALGMRKELQAALLSEESLVRHRERADRQDARPGWTYVVGDVPAAASVGKVVEGVGAGDVARPPPSLAALADKVGRLENDVREAVGKTPRPEDDRPRKMWKGRAATVTAVVILIAAVLIPVLLTSWGSKAEPTVAFYSRIGSTGWVDRNTRISFEDVQSNEGGGYNRTTSVFTAPVRGTYSFSAYLRVGNEFGKTIAIIMVDNNIFATLPVFDGYFGSHSMSVQLEVGQVVYLKAIEHIFYNVGGFSGFLVRPQL